MKKVLFVILTLGLSTVWAQQLNVTTEVEHIKCFGDDNGSIQLNITGGQPPYQINWTHGSNDIALSGLAIGQYGVLIVDNANQSVYKSVNIEGPESPLLITGNSTNVTMFGMSDGTVSAAVSGGSPFKSTLNLYDLSWSNGVVGVYSQESLSNGIYVLTVTDRNDCVATKQFKIISKFNAIQITEDKQLTVFPNPSLGDFKVQSEQQILSAELIDLRTGKIIQLDHSSNDLEVHNLVSGEYQLMLKTEDGEVSLERIQVVR